jgi:uncharacterized membrane protein YqiK
VLPNFWFYRVEPRGQIHRGNARRILQSGSAKESTVAEELRDNFRAFERGIVGKTKPEELDPETKAGLEALGYVQ